jgi:ubiquinol-cytochrome c reductase cytochrome b subunit
MIIQRLITINLLFQIFWDHIGSYPAPKNINYTWSFGALSGICLIIQILTGLFLSMHYVPEVSCAFSSIEHIMRDVNYGWFLRYLHANGASMFFFVIFCHIFRNFYFGSYQNPRILLWFSGVIIFFLLMATAFLGYVLPWGQMSFWGATVITNLFSAIPIYGTLIVEWLWGGFSVDQSTLNRFYSLHFVLPFIIAALALIHLALLHQVGSNDPVSLDSNKDNIHPAVVPFYPYFVIKDFYAFLVMFLILLLLVFFSPNLLGHPDNYINADPMVTPAHIVPEWYFLPFYAILRSIPNKLGGVLAMVFAILGWLILPIFAPIIRSPLFQPYYKLIIWFFAANFILLGWIGQQPVEYPFSNIGAVCTFLYFFILFILIPFLFLLENFISKNKI